MRFWRNPGLSLLLLTLTALSADGAPKRVLIVHSFGSASPPFTTHSIAFETTLTEEMGERVDLDEVSLDVARYTTLDMEEALVELMRKRQAKWQPDLVVPIGSPAGVFVAQYRDRLFPKTTPIIYTGMDQRRLPPGTLQQNATFVGESYHLPGMVEDMLQIATATTNIVVVIGASQLEHYWAEAFRNEWAPFTNRVTFTWLNDLSFDQMLQQVAHTPPRSFIFFILLMRDASGVTLNGDEALKRIHAVANAPVNSIFQHQLGMGIVGGRLYQAELEGIKSARVAIRILQGEPVSNFPPDTVGPLSPRYDWRELRRWKISEDHLPPGSTVLFREPTVWERYRWRIFGVVSIVVVEAVLIIFLVLNLVERRRAEKRLRQSEERMNLAADSAGAGLWSVDLVHRRVWANPRMRELFQFAPDEELTYERFLQVIHPEDQARIREAIVRTVDTGAELTGEFRIVRPDGSQRWIAARGRLDGGPKGKTKRFSGASVDVTQRKLAEEQLRESESRFRTVADSAPVLIWMDGVDKQSNFFNKTWLDFTGRTVEQEMGNGWAEGMHPEDLPGFLKAYQESFDARQAFTLQYRLRRHDGEYRWISDHGVPRYDAQGNFAGYIGSCMDITERRKAAAETHLLQQELTHISRVATMGELTASIAHELNQPLAAILANAQAGLRFMASDKPDLGELRDILHDIVSDDQRAGQVIRHLRSLLKKDGPERRPHPLNNLITDVIAVVRSDAALRNVSIDLDLAPDLPLVTGDRVQLQQVFLNLVVNAFDAMEEVTGRPRKLIVRTRSLGNSEVQVDVTDNGPGIAAEKLRSIFEPFFTTKSSGMGMGLSVSRSIVNAHQGRLWAENNPNGGATFHVVLPATAGPKVV